MEGPRSSQVQERPDPPVGPGEVRIAVKAAGINFADLMARVGLYPDAPKPPASSATRSPGSRVASATASTSLRSGTGSSRAPASAARPSWSPCPADQVVPAPRAAQLRAGRRVPGQLRDRICRARDDGRDPEGRSGPDPRRRRRRRHLRDPDRPLAGEPRSSVPRPPPSTTRSARRASTTRSTTATRTSSRWSGGSRAARGST